MIYIVKKEQFEGLFGAKTRFNIPFIPVDLTDKDVSLLVRNSCYVKEPEKLQITHLEDIDYEKKRSTWIKFKKKNITGRGIKVAVLDNGIQTGYFPVEYSQNFTAGSIVGNHGTMTASIVKDLAPDCILHAVKVIEGSAGSEADILEGLQYCIDNGIHIINMSFSTPKTESVHAALNSLGALGVVMFGSAGNSSTPAEVSYPASHPFVMAVNAVKEDGTAYYKNWIVPEGGSSHGIDIACAGWGNRIIDSAGNTYGNYGTSFSSPFAAGIAALCLEEIGIQNIGSLKQVLKNKATKTRDSVAFGAGILNC